MGHYIHGKACISATNTLKKSRSSSKNLLRMFLNDEISHWYILAYHISYISYTTKQLYAHIWSYVCTVILHTFIAIFIAICRCFTCARYKIFISFNVIFINIPVCFILILYFIIFALSMLLNFLKPTIFIFKNLVQISMFMLRYGSNRFHIYLCQLACIFLVAIGVSLHTVLYNLYSAIRRNYDGRNIFFAIFAQNCLVMGE